jgi:DNA gyrase subunit A
MVVDERNGKVVGSVQVHDTDRVMLITNTGRVIKIGVDGIRETQSRAAKGVTLMRVEKKEKIVAVTRVVEAEEEESEEFATGEE